MTNETQPLPTDAERAQFEEMMRRETFDDLSRVSDGSYKSYEARVGWIAWQAARRTPTPVGVEPVAEIVECEVMGQQTVQEIDGRWKFLRIGTKLYTAEVLAIRRVPLADPEFVQCIKAAGFKTGDSRMWALKREIEAAHGIKGGQHGL